MNTNLIASGLTLAALASSGCYATWDVAPRELTKLHGYRAPVSVPLNTAHGGKVDFDEDTTLAFDDGKPTRYGAVDVRDGYLLARDENGEALPPVSLRRVRTVHGRRLSPGGTAGLVIGVTLGTASLAGVITGVALIAQPGGLFGGHGLGFSSGGGFGGDALRAPLAVRRR